MGAVTIRLAGGLGNQMFQLAAALSLARRRHCVVIVDPTKYAGPRRWSWHKDPDTARAYMLDCFNLPPDVRRRPRLPGRLRRLVGLERRYREPHFHFDEHFHSLECPITLSGYFQSERYFADIARDVRSIYTVRAQLSPPAQQVRAVIAANADAVALHVRRGDYVTNPAAAAYHTLLDLDYYRLALQLVRDRIGHDPQVFLFSDDPAYVEDAFDFVSDRVVIRGDACRPWEDMALMAMCRHHIIANSSFSWWGAWLAGRPGQVVIAPRQWFKGRAAEINNLKDFYPAGWLVV